MSKTTQAVVRGTTRFEPLPPEEWRHGAVTNRCCCPWCSPTERVSVDNPAGVWDTRATCLETGETWLVHAPELHGRPRLRVAP